MEKQIFVCMFACAARWRTESLRVVSGLSSRRRRSRWLLSLPPSPSCLFGPRGHQHRRPTSNALANNNSTQLAAALCMQQSQRTRDLDASSPQTQQSGLSESPQRVPKCVVNDPEPVLQPQWVKRSCWCFKKKRKKKQWMTRFCYISACSSCIV